jgi:adenylate kinase
MKNVRVSVSIFGTVMFEEAKKKGVRNRDDLRKLSVKEQKELQSMAARTISSITDDVVIVDTHAFISTQEGFYPGLPYNVLEILNPDSFIMITARPEEIYNRRMADTSRTRDIVSIDTIKKELDVTSAMLSTCSILCGSPIKMVLNTEGKIDEAARGILNAMGFNHEV